MKLPFTIPEFLEVFKEYNLAVFPAQIIFYAFGIGLILLALTKKHSFHKIISIVLSFFWLWMGIVYHMVYFSAVNNLAYVFGTLFIAQAILFFIYGVLKNTIIFQFNDGFNCAVGVVLIEYALIIYPILGYFLGHNFPAAPTFGVPCPTTIFTFGMLLWTRGRIPVVILIIPLLWSLVGFTAVFSLHMYEDTGLLIAGLSAGTLIILKNVKLTRVSAPIPHNSNDI